MKLDAEGAADGIAEKIAKPLKLDTVAAAQAIVEIAISKMSLAVREVSVAKGYDPRDFALVASGGAGPLHVCAIARELHIPTVIVPLSTLSIPAIRLRRVLFPEPDGPMSTRNSTSLISKVISCSTGTT